MDAHLNGRSLLRWAALIGLAIPAFVLSNAFGRAHVQELNLLLLALVTLIGWVMATGIVWCVLGVVRSVLRLAAPHPDWPARGEFRVRHDAAGLPIVEWLEHALHPPRRVWIERDPQTGEFLFCTRDWLGHIEEPGWIKTALMMAVMAALPIAAMLLRWRDYRYGDELPPMMAFMAVLMLEVMALLVYVAVCAVRQRMALLAGGGNTHGATRRAPWAALQGFLMSDERALYGKGGKDASGRDLPTNAVLLAEFGIAAQRFEVSNYNWSVNAMAELARVLTLEFIARRSEYVARCGARSREVEEAGVPVALQ